MNTLRKVSGWILVSMLLLSANLVMTNTPTAFAAPPAVVSCYSGGVRFGASNVPPNATTAWSQTFTASTRCVDINFLPDVSMKVQIAFYPSSGGVQLTELRTVQAGHWQKIATNVRDGTHFRIRLNNNSSQTRTLHGTLAY